MESDVALDSGVTIVAKRNGIVDKIDGKRIVVGDIYGKASVFNIDKEVKFFNNFSCIHPKRKTRSNLRSWSHKLKIINKLYNKIKIFNFI